MMCAEDEKVQATLKIRFLTAVCKGELGSVTDEGVVVTLDEFRVFFSDITSDYVNSFLPAATLEPGRTQMTPSRFIFRLRLGVYLVHPDVFGCPARGAIIKNFQKKP
ncbi:MAG TPA: hypothetical protein ENJ08_12700 [Gammaproteobacteria bacterium]|nr:hypothetical protein [Gammaproteobacteria bacterium]